MEFLQLLSEPLLREFSMQVALAVIIIQLTVSTVYYFSIFRPTYMRLVNAMRGPVFDSTQLPSRPLRALLGNTAASLVLTAALNYLAIRFQVDTWQEGLRMAAALVLIDSCINARHHFFEGRPLSLFLLHLGYHSLLLGSTCCLLAVFGQPLSGRGGGLERGGGAVQPSAAAAAAGRGLAPPGGHAEL